MRVIAEQQNEKKSYSNLTILNKNSKLTLSHRKFSYFFFVMGRLVEAFPTAVVLENGVIKEKWVEVMPRNFIQRIKPNLVVSRLCEV